MINRLKNFVKSILGINQNRKIVSEWVGDYSDWTTALKNSNGYDAKLVLEKIRVNTGKVRDNQAVYVRDSFLFDKIEYSWPLAAIIQKTFLKDGFLNVIDFGGGLGSTYYQNKEFTTNMNSFSWNIVEQPSLVKIGKSEFQDDKLFFYNTIDEVLSIKRVNLIILSGVLQCIENPSQIIESIIQNKIPTIFIDRNAFIFDIKSRISIQQVAKEIYDASYPSHFFLENEFIELFQKSYNLEADFKSYCDRDQVTNDGKSVYWKGFYFTIR